jgi:hypothetical protein
MTAADFRRIALSFDGAEEGSHMGAVDFRVGGRIFATLASVKQGFGNLALTPEMQAEFVAEAPDVFVPMTGGWGQSQQTFPPRVANAPAVAIDGVTVVAMIRPVATATIGFRDVTAHADRCEIHHHLVAVIALVAHDFFDTLALAHHGLHLFGGLDQRPSPIFEPRFAAEARMVFALRR